jgi:hypothetical protein
MSVCALAIGGRRAREIETPNTAPTRNLNFGKVVTSLPNPIVMKTPSVLGAVPCALAGHGTLAFRRCTAAGQWLPPPPASTNVRITASRLKEAGF